MGFEYTCILVMLVFTVIIGGIIMLVSMQNLKNRVTKLEQQLQQGTIPSAAQTARQTAPTPLQTVSSTPAPPPPVYQPPKPLGAGDTPADRFVRWIREDWLLKLGAFLLLVAFGWLTTYAFLNNWIGPMGRITVGLVAGVAFIVLGWWRIQKYLHQGGIFLVLGSTTILLTIYAAREIYDFFTPLSALAMMFLSTAFVALASVKYNSRTLALSSIILAGIAPVLTNSPRSNDVALFSYLLVVTLGTVWIVFLTGRRELTLAALAIIAIYSIPSFEVYRYTDTSHLLPFSFAFAAIFFIINSIGIVKAGERKSIADLITAAANGMLLLGWIVTAAPDEWKTLLICAWMIVFVVGAFMLSRYTGRLDPFYVYAGVGIVMIAAATAVELRGPSLTIAYSVEAAMIAVLSYVLRRDVRLSQIYSLLIVIPMMMSAESMFSYTWEYSVFHKDFAVLAVIVALLFGLGFFYRLPALRSSANGIKQLSIAYFILGSIWAYILLWLSLHAALVNEDNAVMFFLFTLTVIGLISYIYGRSKEKKIFAVYGGSMLGFVVCRLLMVDVWKMELTGRIITFFAVGALLMSTAFLVRRKRTTAETTDKGSE